MFLNLKKFKIKDDSLLDFIILDKIDWRWLSRNPNYNRMRKTIEDINREIIENFWHPLRVERMIEKYGDEILEEM